jgi:hypothetical protein
MLRLYNDQPDSLGNHPASTTTGITSGILSHLKIMLGIEINVLYVLMMHYSLNRQT